MKSYLIGVSIMALLFISLWGNSYSSEALSFSDEFVKVVYKEDVRTYNEKHQIRVSQFYNRKGIKSTKIRLIPNDQSFTHFILNIPGTEIGEYINGDIEFSLLDYCNDRSYQKMVVNCSNKECYINMKATITAYGDKGDRVVGKVVGDYLFVDEHIHFEVDFNVVLE